MTREVVITGLGIVSPIGVGREAFELALRDGKSGVGTIQQFDSQAMQVKIGAEVTDFEPKQYVKPRKSLKVMCREIQLGVASATLAAEDAELNTEEVESDRFGVVYGCPMFYSEPVELERLFQKCISDDKEFDFSRFGEAAAKQMQPLWMLKYLPNMTASHIGIAHNARGPNNSIVMGDVSSLLAVIEAATVIQRGLADVMLTGGSGNRLSLTGVVYRGDSNLSKCPDPSTASRPFDSERDGQVIGEGACTIVLEDREYAEQRGATIYGRITGFGTTHAGTDMHEGMPAAIARSIKTSLATANIDAVGEVNAHGLSDIEHDIREAQAIQTTLGSQVPVSAIKSYFGNVGAASGALELAASLCLPDEVPATLNLHQRDPKCEINVAANSVSRQSPVILKLGQTAMGQAVSLLVQTSS